MMISFIGIGLMFVDAGTVKVLIMDNECEGLFYEYRGKKVELKMQPRVFSEELKIPSNGMLNLFREVSVVNEDSGEEELVVQGVGEITIDSRIRKGLLFLTVPEDLPEAKIEGQIFEDSGRGHREGTLKIFNMAHAPIKLEVGGREKVVPHEGSQLVKWKGEDGGIVSYQISIKESEESEEEVEEEVIEEEEVTGEGVEAEVEEARSGWVVVDRNERAARPKERIYCVVSRGRLPGEQMANATMIMESVD